jgi:hypothetical protein
MRGIRFKMGNLKIFKNKELICLKKHPLKAKDV